MKLIFLSLVLFSITSFAKDQALEVKLSVTANGFEPNKIDVPPQKPVTLQVTRTTDDTCATEIQIPSLKLRKKLPLNKTVSIDLGRLEKGEIRFGCGMNMMDSGMIYVK